MDINSLPAVSSSQLKAMEKAAQEKFGMEQTVSEQPIQVQEEQQEQSIQPEVQEQPQQPYRKTPAESFSELKAKADRSARERDEYAQKIQEYERALKQQQESSTPKKTPSLAIGADDLVEGKHLSQVYEELNELKRQQQDAYQTTMLANTEARLKMQYTDFDKVVSQDNLQLLSYTYPELAHTLNSATDLYSKAVSAYTMIKQMGIYKNDAFDADKKRVYENSMKPRLSPAASAHQGDTPLSKANMFAEEGLTEELKKQLVKEMFAARNKI